MITKLQFVEYLISTFGNYTGSHLAEHFFTTLKENWLVSLSKEEGYIHFGPDRVNPRTTTARRARETAKSLVQGAVVQAGRHERRH